MKFSDIFRNEAVIMALLFGLMVLAWNFCESVGIDSEWTALIIPISILLFMGYAFIKGIFIIVRSMYLKHRPKNSSNPTYIKTMKKYNVSTCIYGHLHGETATREAKEGKINDIDFKLVSCDYTKFDLVRF